MVHYVPPRTRLAQLWLVGALACFPALAQAAPSAADRAAAEVLFDSAVKLLESGNGKEACPKLEESQRLDPGVGTLLYLAECYRIVGRTASAWATFREASYAAEAAGQTDRVQVANSEASRLKPMLSYISLVVTEPQLAGLEIKRDGEVVNRALWSSPIPIDPGQHQLEATAPGKLPWSKSMDVAATPGTTSITIPTLQDAPVEPPAAPVAAPAGEAAQLAPAASAAPGGNTSPPADAQPTDSSRKTLGWVALGVGGVGVAVGGVFGYLASKDNSEVDQHCRPDDPTRCNSEGVQLADQAKSRALLSSIAFGVGLAAATTGVVLILTAPDASDTAQRRVWLSAESGGDTMAMSLGGAW